MANVTIAVDDVTLKRARRRAFEQGTSVNAIVRAHLDAYAAGDPSSAVVGRLIELARSSSGGSGPGGRTWTRDELHER